MGASRPVGAGLYVAGHAVPFPDREIPSVSYLSSVPASIRIEPIVAPSDDGMLLGALRDGTLLGYACLYWSFTSLVPAETVLLNDLYVDSPTRGQGVGRALIEASAAVGRERGAQRLEWMTQAASRLPIAPAPSRGALPG
jgi:GNAT superfamily N-acetyltransferase